MSRTKNIVGRIEPGNFTLTGLFLAIVPGLVNLQYMTNAP